MLTNIIEHLNKINYMQMFLALSLPTYKQTLYNLVI